MSTTHVVILAAGKGTRMKSARPKVLHQVAGAPMIDYVLDAAAALGAATRTVVVGHEAAQVRAALGAHADLRFVLQEPQLGTAHAVQQAAPLFEGVAGTLLLLSGDVPLLSVDTLRALLARHEETGAAVTILTAIVSNPFGYGRILRDGDAVTAIVEQRDATPAEREIREINSGIYALDLEPLFPSLARIAPTTRRRSST
jgi:bifunctional UDP-N-acetylglucosamine pyrophosphorylase/glucosamine-1-phosphate N-acetyltransferase